MNKTTINRIKSLLPNGEPKYIRAYDNGGISADRYIVDALKVKLNPRRFTSMSAKMAAIVAYILGESWTNPAISGLMVTSDGFLLACRTGDCGYNDFIGAESDLKDNWGHLLYVAGLSNEEQAKADALYAAKVKHC